MKTKDWTPSEEQKQQWEEQGYFVLRNVVPRDLAIDMRGVIKNELLKPEPEGRPDEAVLEMKDLGEKTFYGG